MVCESSRRDHRHEVFRRRPDGDAGRVFQPVCVFGVNADEQGLAGKAVRQRNKMPGVVSHLVLRVRVQLAGLVDKASTEVSFKRR